MVEVEKTGGFSRFLRCPRDPLRRSAWSRIKNLRCARDPLRRSAWSMSKTVGFLRFSRCARDPLRRSAWSMSKNCGLFTILAVRARPCGDRSWCVSTRSRCGAVRIRLSLGELSAEIVRVKALSLWRRAISLLAKWPLEVVSWLARLLLQSRGRGFDSPGPRQLQLENRNF